MIVEILSDDNIIPLSRHDKQDFYDRYYYHLRTIMMLFPTFLQIFYFLFFMNCFYKLNKSKHLSFFLLLGTTILLYFCNYKGISILGKVVLLLSLFLYTIYIFDGSIKKKLQTLLLGVSQSVVQNL